MEEFIGRERELAALQKKFNRDSFCMSIVYGRRRIGKTMLINEFIRRQDCKKLCFTAVEQNERILLSMMCTSVLETLAPDMVGIVDFPDFDSLFTFIGNCAKRERIIFFIDEYPYLATQCPHVQSILQKHIDTSWKNTNLFFIICGSLVGFMKDEVLAKSAPLYGRSDLELNLKPFDYYETSLFFKGYSNEEKAIAYGLTGGVAKYIRQFDPTITLEENIRMQFFSLGGYFSEEQVKTVITSERQNPALYNSIISAVATGHTRNNEIASYCGVQEVTYPLKVLQKGEILEKRNAKKPYYILSDSMLEFWFRYVSPAIGLINAGNGEKYFENRVRDKLHEFMGKVFEKMSKQYLLKHSGTDLLPLITELEEYQSSFLDEDRKVCQIELDLVGKLDKDIVLIGECKFRNEKFDKSELDKFLRKVQALDAKDPTLCIFSLAGFSDYVKEKSDRILLIDINKMYE